MLKIGAFSRLVQVSVRMLRHYERLGLLRPSRVDAGVMTGDLLLAIVRARARAARLLEALGVDLRQADALLEERMRDTRAGVD